MEQEKKMKELEGRVQYLESEVSQLAQQVQILKTQSSPKNSEQVVQRAGVLNPKDQPVKKLYRQEGLSPYKEQEKTDWEQVLLQTWLPRIFIFVFVIGVLWGLKAASDYGWLNDTVKIGLGYLTALGLLYTGINQVKYKREVLGQVLAGGGIAVFILTTFAMHSVYGMVGSVPAFLLLVIGIAAGVWLTIRFRSQSLGILSVVGGFLVPFLIESSEPSVLFFTVYETFLFFVFFVLAVREKFQYLYIASFALLHLTLLLFNGLTPYSDLEYLLAAALLIQHAGILYFLLRKNIFRKVQVSILFASAIFTYGWVNGIWPEGAVTAFLAAGVLVYSVLSYLFRKKENMDVLPTIALVYLFFFIFDTVSDDFTGALLLIQGVAAYYLAVQWKSAVNKGVAAFIYFVGLASVLYTPIEAVLSSETLQWLVLLSSFIVGTKLIYEQTRKAPIILTSSLLFTFFCLVFISQLVWTAAEELPYENQTLWLSVSWISLAVLSICLWLWKGFNQAKYIGVGLLMLTLVKLILLDLPFIPILFRAILFIILGAIGLAASRAFYKKGSVNHRC
jgi:uncharacterized membrane protein